MRPSSRRARILCGALAALVAAPASAAAQDALAEDVPEVEQLLQVSIDFF